MIKEFLFRNTQPVQQIRFIFRMNRCNGNKRAMHDRCQYMPEGHK
jgi:hypothetical protein